MQPAHGYSWCSTLIANFTMPSPWPIDHVHDVAVLHFLVGRQDQVDVLVAGVRAA